MTDTTTRRCPIMAPDALVGHLGRLQCTLVQHHRGDHRSSKTITGVGKIIVKWRPTKSQQPPVIVLPKALIS